MKYIHTNTHKHEVNKFYCVITETWGGGQKKEKKKTETRTKQTKMNEHSKNLND